MRILRAIFVALCLLLIGAGTARATFTQIAHGASTSDGSVVLNTTGANLIVLVWSYYSGASGLSTPDSLGNTWTALTPHGTVGNVTVNIYYVTNPSVGVGHTFTTNGTNTYSSFYVAAFSGALTTGTLDGQNGSASASASSIASGSITPGQPNELIIAGLSTGTGIPSSIAPTMTINDSIPVGGGFNGGALAYVIQTTATAINPTWTLPSANYCASIVASFIASSGGGGSVFVRRRVTQ